MNIDETLKDNLLTDVEQTLDITLTENDKTSLARAFEITIGHHYDSNILARKNLYLWIHRGVIKEIAWSHGTLQYRPIES